MGYHKVTPIESKEEKLRFIEVLLNDIQALEQMLEGGMIENDITRAGMEQELYLIDKSFRPSLHSMEALDLIKDKHFTTELAKYNLEINLDPEVVEGDVFSRLHARLNSHLAYASKKLQQIGADPLLVGILPTLKGADVSIENMAPVDRYYALDKVLSGLKGGDFEFRISGTDELIMKHSSVMFESVNTSFQVHLQIKPEEFVSKYNWAKVLSGPILSAVTCSPLLFGKKLWKETRIALFQQSVDIRKEQELHREISPRVTFGNQWAMSDLVDIFKEDIVRYKVLLQRQLDTDSIAKLEKGLIPKLEALMVHNGTIYKWNRACYGVTNKKPHVRIENRYIPSGPTPIDEIANSAFWIGCMLGQPDDLKDLPAIFEFDDVKSNFLRAARQGLSAQFEWVGNRTIPAQELILNELIPMAKEGLANTGVADEDIERYIGIIEERVKTKKTGSQWLLESFDKIKKQGNKDEALVAVTAGLFNRQQSDTPVHTWDLCSIEEAGSWENYYYQIEQIMSTNLYAVQEDDYIQLVASIMNWKHVRHVPVEDTDGRLVGLITSGILVEHFSKGDVEKRVSIKEIMIKDPIVVTPETLTTKALGLMKEHKIGCLPVVSDDRLVGIVTERDFVDIAFQLFKEIQEKGSVKE